MKASKRHRFIVPKTGLLKLLKFKFQSPNVTGPIIRDLKQARTATAGNKQLNFAVKTNHTQPTIYTAYLKHIL